MSSLQNSFIFSIQLALLLASTVTANHTFYEHFTKAKLTSTPRKMTHLHFYFHDIVSGKNPTAITIMGPKVAFGLTSIMDDPLTVDTKPGSTIVGRAQGLYALASQHDVGLLMVVTFAFTYGKYNGSSLTVMGRNCVLDAVREMAVIGGSGLFRFARGYALANTVRYKPKTGIAVVQYNVTVMHGTS